VAISSILSLVVLGPSTLEGLPFLVIRETYKRQIGQPTY
jgi:hypothetical protein